MMGGGGAGGRKAEPTEGQNLWNTMMMFFKMKKMQAYNQHKMAKEKSGLQSSLGNGMYGDKMSYRKKRSAEAETASSGSEASAGSSPLLSRKKRFMNMMMPGMSPMMGGMGGMGGLGMLAMMLGDSPDPPPAGAGGMMSPFGMGMGGMGMGGMGMGGMGMMNPMSMMMGTARDANGKKIDYGDIMKNQMRNGFHMAMTGRALPPGQDGGDFVKNMAPIWAMKRMQRMQRLQQAQQHILQKPARDRAAKAASNARYVEYIRRVQSQIPPSLRNQKSQQTVNPTKSVG